MAVKSPSLENRSQNSGQHHIIAHRQQRYEDPPGVNSAPFPKLSDGNLGQPNSRICTLLVRGEILNGKSNISCSSLLTDLSMKPSHLFNRYTHCLSVGADLCSHEKMLLRAPLSTSTHQISYGVSTACSTEPRRFTLNLLHH